MGISSDFTPCPFNLNLANREITYSKITTNFIYLSIIDNSDSSYAIIRIDSTQTASHAQVFQQKITKIDSEVVDFHEDNSKNCCFITLLNKKQLKWDFIEQKPVPVDNSKIQSNSTQGGTVRVPYRRLTNQIYISTSGSIYNAETLQVHASLEKNQKPTGVLCSNQDTSNWQISTADKIYKFTTNSTNLEILFDVSSDSRKSANFSPFEECLYERLNYRAVLRKNTEMAEI